MNTASFGFDRRFLKQNDSNLVQLTRGDASVLVSPRYQAKVFTSTVAGDEGRSLGWINYKAFSATIDPHMNAYGGENRFWIGPEGGRYSVFFDPGEEMQFENWKTPPPVDVEPWGLVRKNDTSVVLRKNMNVQNYTGFTLFMNAERVVSILDSRSIELTLGIVPGDSVRYVGYSTLNTLRNTGTVAWDDTTGMPCIWILDMFNPSPLTTIIIPFKPAPENEKVATTDYFGEVGRSRLRITDSLIFFKADGKKRGKIGVLPQYARSVAGSYDPALSLLTIIHFTVDSSGQYLNQEWNTTDEPFSGDAINAYNDGPLKDGSQMGPFYELESVSPAARLKPGEAIVHRHDVFHFSGGKKFLDSIAVNVLGVSLYRVDRVFR